MRYFITLVLVTLSTMLYAHRGSFLAISNVQVTETKLTYIYEFEIENIKQVEVRDVKIEFVVNTKSVFQKYYDKIEGKHKFQKDYFEVPKKWINPERDIIQIEITEVFGKKDDWGGWDSPTLKQVNTAASDFIADAPWRMKKTDDNGNVRDVPIHIFLHDADEVIGNGNQVDYIDIKIKNTGNNLFSTALRYDTLSDAAYQNLFSCMSVQDNDMGVRGFDFSTFEKSVLHTIDFTAETDWMTTNYYLQIDEDFWYFTFNIPAASLVGMDDIFDVEIYIKYDNSSFWPEDYDNVKLRIFRHDEDIPKQDNFYRGDTHLHSMYTQNSAEIGNPLCGTKEAAKLIGLDWITTTDHTSDFDNYGTGNINTNWDRIKAEAAALNADDPSLIYIPGQEVAVNNSNDDLVHMLAYPSYTSVSTFPFLGDGNGDLSGTSKTVNSVASELASFNGFSYAAHPFATDDKLPTIPVGGGIWNLGDPGFPVNGNNFPETGGEIICNDALVDSDILTYNNGKLIIDGVKGAQIWNVRNTLSTSGDANDPWDVMNLGDPFTPEDTASTGFHIKRFRQGQEITNYINQLGLKLKNQDSTYQNWKLYISAGADAHGSFNYSNTGDFAGFGSINNNAVGKMTTLTYSENGMGSNGENVLKAMYNGNTTLSDGPILSIGMSIDGNDLQNEVLMGEDEKIYYERIEDYFMNLHYTTTPEYGSVTKLTAIFGTENGEVKKHIYFADSTGDQTMTFALMDLVDTVMGIDAFNFEKYLYFRAELQTFKDRGASTTQYRMGYDYYHSFTNPVWFKVTEEPEFPSEELELEAYPNPFDKEFNLIIRVPGQEDVSLGIYNDIGQLIYSEVIAVDNDLTVPLNAAQLGMSSGMYTIRAVVREQSVEIKVVND